MACLYTESKCFSYNVLSTTVSDSPMGKKKPAPKGRLRELKLDDTPPVPYAQRLKTFLG